jgi:hypothetical protein
MTPNSHARASSLLFAAMMVAGAAASGGMACSSSPGAAGASVDAGAGADASGSDTGVVTTGLTFHKDVRPIMTSKCIGCHTTGGFAPFPLVTYADVIAERAMVAGAVDSKVMPPWPPDDSCNTYQHDRSLTDAERNTIVTWARGDAAEGDPATYVAPSGASVTPIRVDATMQMPTPYTMVQSPDEYRCFVLDWSPTAVKYVTGLNVRPGDSQVVHHAIAFIINPSDVATVQSLDAADSAPGYTCFGGVGVNSAQWLGAWVPGTVPDTFPANSGIKVQPGSKIVLQMHYNTANATPAPDQSSLDVQLEDTVATEATVLKFTNPSWVKSHTMNIKAGDPDSVQSYAIDPTPYMSLITGSVLPSNMPFKIWSAALHMHSRGVKGTLSIVHADGSKTCALQIDDWSFHWQGSYALGAALTFQPGDQLSIECHFDNSGDRQPLVDGRPVPVADVNWGETTEDEMCLGVFYATP